jgi:hypothetical protein
MFMFSWKNQKLHILYLFIIFSGSMAVYSDDSQPVVVIEPDEYSFEVGSVIRIPVEIFGLKHQFVLDTGCTNTVFDESFRDRLGPVVKRAKVSTPTATRDHDFFAAPEIVIGSLVQDKYRSEKPIGIGELASLRTATGRNEMGLLGMDYLASRVIRIQFERGLVQIDTTAKMQSGDSEKIFMRNRQAYILIGIPNEGFPSFTIDTGNSGSFSLERKLFERLVQIGRIVLQRDGTAAEVGGIRVARRGILDRIEFGGRQFCNVRVNEHLRNMVGLRFLEKYDIEFDFPNQIAYFRPNGQIELLEYKNRAEFGVRRVMGRTLIADIDPTGVTANEGLCDDDEILSINGNSAEHLTVVQIHKMICNRDAATMKITYRRDGVIQDACITLSNTPEPFSLVPQQENRPQQEKNDPFDD